LLFVINNEPFYPLAVAAGGRVAGGIDEARDILTADGFVLVRPDRAPALYQLGALLEADFLRLCHGRAQLRRALSVNDAIRRAHGDTMPAPDTIVFDTGRGMGVLLFLAKD
jgi:hypothetical protein